MSIDNSKSHDNDAKTYVLLRFLEWSETKHFNKSSKGIKRFKISKCISKISNKGATWKTQLGHDRSLT